MKRIHDRHIIELDIHLVNVLANIFCGSAHTCILAKERSASGPPTVLFRTCLKPRTEISQSLNFSLSHITNSLSYDVIVSQSTPGKYYCTNSFSENCKFQITIFRLLHLPLHFVHVVSTYAALIKTPKGRKGNIHPTLDFVSIALSRVFPFVFKLVFYLFSNLPDCNTLKNLPLI